MLGFFLLIIRFGKKIKATQAPSYSFPKKDFRNRKILAIFVSFLILTSYTLIDFDSNYDYIPLFPFLSIWGSFFIVTLTSKLAISFHRRAPTISLKKMEGCFFAISLLITSIYGLQCPFGYKTPPLSKKRGSLDEQKKVAERIQNMHPSTIFAIDAPSILFLLKRRNYRGAPALHPPSHLKGLYDEYLQALNMSDLVVIGVGNLTTLKAYWSGGLFKPVRKTLTRHFNLSYKTEHYQIYQSLKTNSSFAD